ncbi:MAG: transposase [Sulfobacillus sp.]
MPMRGAQPPLRLSEADRHYLEQIVQSLQPDNRRLERARILLGYAQGQSLEHIAQQHGLTTSKVRRCVEKALSFGPRSALDDVPRPGRPLRITAEARSWIVSLIFQNPQNLGYSEAHWTERLLAHHIRNNAASLGHPSASNISPGTISKILSAETAQSLHSPYYGDRHAPSFHHTRVPVLHIYQSIEWRHAGSEKDTGPLTLLAGIDLQTAEVRGIVRSQHGGEEFVQWLELLHTQYPKELQIDVVVDHHASHTSQETRAYLATVPNRFEFVFSPTQGNWLNLIECFFVKLLHQFAETLQASSQGVAQNQLEQFLSDINTDAVRFRWHKLTAAETIW